MFFLNHYMNTSFNETWIASRKPLILVNVGRFKPKIPKVIANQLECYVTDVIVQRYEIYTGGEI